VDVSSVSSEIIEENNYYPFGLKHKGYNNVISSNGNSVAQKFKYNGIELEESLGLNLYEMGHRMYNPAIGRFMGIDPVTHFSQGTSVAFDNDPIFWADPSGADATSFVTDLFNSSSDGTTWTNNNGTYTNNKDQRSVIVDPNGNESNFADDWYSAVDGNLVMTNGTDYQVWDPGSGKYVKGRAPKNHRGNTLGGLPTNAQIGDTFTQSLADPYGVLFTAANDSRELSYIGDGGWIVEKDFTSARSRKFASNFIPIGAGLKWGGKLANWALKYKAGKTLVNGSKVFFGKNANQISHTFRHIEKAGLSRVEVTNAINSNIRTRTIKSGAPNNFSITVNNQEIIYTAFQVNKNTINVGRIVIPK
ncbi:MAG: RHS repeat-associated core domain-containing protein, partial [Polaribacter sp.]